MDRPVLWGSVLFICGILIAHYFSKTTTLWLTLAGACFFAVLFTYLFKNGDYQKRVKITAILLALSFLFLGAFWYSLSRYPETFSGDYVGLAVHGEGEVISYPKEKEYGFSCYIKVKELRSEKSQLFSVNKILLTAKNLPENTLLPGDILKFRGELSLPAEARNPGGFNYREYLAHQEVFFIADCYKGKVEIIKKGQGVQTLAARCRLQVVQHLNKILPQRERGLILGMLFGETGSMAEEEWDAYQRTGVVHLFSVSGLHVAMVLGLIWFLLSFIKLRPLIRLILGAMVLSGYGFMTGWCASILRASVMALLGLLALTVKRKNDVYNALGVAAWVVLIFQPGELFQVGFQLSFITTLGIIYLTPWLEKKLYCGKLLAVPLAAFLSSTPILAYHFSQVSLISPLANIFAVAVSSFATALSFIAAVLTWFLPALATPFFLTAGSIMYILSEILIWCAEFRWAGINIASPSPPVIILLYLILAILPVLSHWRYIIRNINVRIKTIVVFLWTLTVLFSCWPTAGEMEVVFLDVGQGDSFFIRTPGGRTALIDGGGSPGSTFAVGKNVVSPVLYHYGVNKIDLLMMSHNHLDHSEGLSEIIPDFQVGTFFMPPSEESNEMEKKIRELCQYKKIPLHELTAGKRIRLERDVFLKVLYPMAEDDYNGNNRSLVVKIIYKGCTWLLTGDIEKEAIDRLLARNVDLRADILKIPHHGSITSLVPLFYERVNPQAVIISVGENNFNQPHDEIKKYFLEKGIPVYITRDMGAIMTKSNGQKIMLSTFL